VWFVFEYSLSPTSFVVLSAARLAARPADKLAKFSLLKSNLLEEAEATKLSAHHTLVTCYSEAGAPAEIRIFSIDP
jgi:hypothetical protein